MINTNPDYSVTIELTWRSSGMDSQRDLSTSSGFTGSELKQGITDLLDQGVHVIVTNLFNPYQNGS